MPATLAALPAARRRFRISLVVVIRSPYSRANIIAPAIIKRPPAPRATVRRSPRKSAANKMTNATLSLSTVHLIDALRDVLDAVPQGRLGDPFLIEDDNLLDRAYAALQILANDQDLSDHKGRA